MPDINARDIMLIAICIVLIILVIVYFVYPEYYEKYVLMNIPEYKKLKHVMYESDILLGDTRSAIDKLKLEYTTMVTNKSKSIRNKSAVIRNKSAVIRNKSAVINELRQRLSSNAEELARLTMRTADYKEQLHKAVGNKEDCSRLQLGATEKMKEINDLIIKEFKFKDKKLAAKLQSTRESILKYVTVNKKILCDNKDMFITQIVLALVGLQQINTSIKSCDFYSVNNKSSDKITFLKKLRDSIFYSQKHCINYKITAPHTDGSGPVTSVIHPTEAHSIYERLQYRYPDGKVSMECAVSSVSPLLFSIFDNIENVISHIIQNNFCVEGVGLDIGKIREYMIRVIEGICDSDDWKNTATSVIDYIISKPSVYLPDEL